MHPLKKGSTVLGSSLVKPLTNTLLVVGDGIDPSTSRFSGARSTN